MGCHHEQLERLDARLFAVAREEAALRLRLGQVFEVLGRRAQYCELGFSSIGAYALERGERSVRWVEVARCLARRLEGLPRLRSALAAGSISWSMAELVARVAQPLDEAGWLDLARAHTLREMRQRLSLAAPAMESAEMESAEMVAREVSEVKCTLTCTVDQEDAWLFEATRILLERLGTRDADEQLEALLAEGQGTLLAALPPGALALDTSDVVDGAQQRWREQLQRWRRQAEEQCEPGIRGAVLGRAPLEALPAGVAAEAALGCAALEGGSALRLDGIVRQLCRALARHELELAQLLLAFHRADGWRRLGYATEAQHARERLGMSRSSVLARRALAARLEVLPAVAQALSEADIGVEAALQVVRIATPRTELAWLERSRRRTVKHLREEVVAALVAVRLSGESDCLPPEEGEVEAFQKLEQAVVSGSVCAGSKGSLSATPCDEKPCDEKPCAAEVRGERAAWRSMLASLGSWLDQGVQLSASSARPGSGEKDRRSASAGRVKLRLRVSRSTYEWWRLLEGQARRRLVRGVSWVKFLCLSLWRAWCPLVERGKDVAYGHVYVRDRWRCASPVCSRTDVTPHHLQFRSAGGGDEDDNVASLCSWCHLFGVHGGHIRAAGSARHIRWELGSRAQPCLRVDGRQRA